MSVAEARRNPLTYVVPLYFMQALPVFLVQDVSMTIFKGLGIENQAIATWTSLIALPWSFKLLWGPIVELNGTKRRWITLCQMGIAALIILLALALQVPNPLGVALAVLAVTAVFSATCDIATDGYYLLATDRQSQKVFVGWQSTFFRLGRLFATGGVVALAGLLIERGMSQPTAWMLALFGLAVVYGGGAILNHFTLPRPAVDVPAPMDPAENRLNLGRTVLVIIAFGWFYFGLAYGFGLVGHALSWLLPGWTLKGELDWYLLFIRLAGGMDSRLLHGLNAAIGLAMGALFGSLAGRTLKGTQLGEAFGSFFGQRDIWAILSFVLFYRFGEAMLGRIVPIFLQDKRDGPDDPTQGLGFSVLDVGIVNGTWGVIGIVAGGIVGGFLISRIGVRKSFWILALAMNLPNVLYWIASVNPAIANVPAMATIMFFDQFGYGFGFAGYLICLQAIAQRNPKFTTAHYAIGTGMGALLIAAAGTLSGALMASLDFPAIFIIVLFATIPCLITLRFIPVDETSGIQVSNTDLAD
ncbi:MAG: MFS transporter [Fimbriimonadaceae bacterium]|nr:MFS transporter [Fimbriimonadaceae bacterium]